MEAQNKLKEKNVAAQVVSMPSTGHFDHQDLNYKESVLPKNSLKVAIEAASGFGWEKYIGQDGVFIGMHSFGASGPYQELYKHFKITADEAVKQALSRLK